MISVHSDGEQPAKRIGVRDNRCTTSDLQAKKLRIQQGKRNCHKDISVQAFKEGL